MHAGGTSGSYLAGSGLIMFPCLAAPLLPRSPSSDMASSLGNRGEQSQTPR